MCQTLSTLSVLIAQSMMWVLVPDPSYIRKLSIREEN